MIKNPRSSPFLELLERGLNPKPTCMQDIETKNIKQTLGTFSFLRLIPKPVQFSNRGVDLRDGISSPYRNASSLNRYTFEHGEPMSYLDFGRLLAFQAI